MHFCNYIVTGVIYLFLGKIWLNGVQCIGAEILDDCSYSFHGSVSTFCSTIHLDDVGVVCMPGLFLHLALCLSVHLSQSLSVCLSLSLYLPSCMSVCFPLSHSVSLPFFLSSVCLLVSLSLLCYTLQVHYFKMASAKKQKS